MQQVDDLVSQDADVELTKTRLSRRRGYVAPKVEEIMHQPRRLDVDIIPRILYSAVGVLFMMAIFPPFSVKGEYGRSLFSGYHFIFTPSVRATVDVPVLFAQAFFVLLIAALVIGAELYKRRKKRASFGEVRF